MKKISIILLIAVPYLLQAQPTGISNRWYFGGELELGTTSPSYDISMNGDSARNIGLQAKSTSGTANTFSLYGSDAKSGESNTLGGNFNIYSGRGTGTTGSSINFYTSPVGSTGASYNNQTLKWSMNADGSMQSALGLYLENTTHSIFKAFDLSIRSNTSVTIIGRTEGGVGQYLKQYTTHTEIGNENGNTTLRFNTTYGNGVVDFAIMNSGNSGRSLTLNGGNCGSFQGTPLNGGDLILKGGSSGGTGSSNILFYTATSGVGTPNLKATLDGNGVFIVENSQQVKTGYLSSLIDNLTSATADTLFSIPLVADSSVNMTMTYGINATDGDTTQAESGIMLISAVNANGVLKYSFTTLGSTQPTEILGTLSKSLTCILASNVLYVVVNVTSSIAPSTMKIRATPDIHSSYQITKFPY